MRHENLSQEEIEKLLREAEQAIQEEHSTAAEEGVPEKEMVSGVSDEHEDMLAVDDEKPDEPVEIPEHVQPSIRVAEFEEFKMEPGPEKPVSDMGVLMDIPLSISVELGRSKCYVRDLLNLTVGSIVELDRLAGDPVDILVNGKLFAKGEVVVIDENFGVRIQEVLGQDKRH